MHNRIPMFINTIANSYKGIGIYGDNEQASQIFDYLKKIDGLFVEKYNKDSFSNANNIVSSEIEIIIKTEEADGKFIYHDNSICYSIDYSRVAESNYTNPSEDIYTNIAKELIKCGVRVFFVKSPDLHMYKPRIPLYISMGILGKIVEKLPFRDYILLRHLKQNAVLEDFKKTKADNLKGYIRVHGNGQYINYDNGFRRIPCEYDIVDTANTIYLFGYCISANPMLQDSDTICANIQKKAQEKYRVISKSNDQSAINFIMRDTHFREGDCVFIFTSYHDKTPEKLGFATIELTEVYNKIPFLWRHITDSSFHIDAILSDVIASKLWSVIEGGDNKSSQKRTEISFGPLQKEAPDISMYKNAKLEKYYADLAQNIPDSVRKGNNGAIVMNCNPFTLGHLHLIRNAVKKVDNLFIFVVSEDKSFFKYVDRLQMVKEGVKEIDNVYVFPSGEYMISATTLPGYFDKKHLGNISLSATEDLELFASIAEGLNIFKRFAGTEPNDKFTEKYNKEMACILPRYGIEFVEEDRCNNAAQEMISASKVRELIESGKIDKLKGFIPESTYRILREKKYI